MQHSTTTKPPYVKLRRLIDRHAPCVTKRPRQRLSARWFDAECLNCKTDNEAPIEKLYRRSRSAVDRAAWRQQFDYHRGLYQENLIEFWSATIEDCHNNPRASTLAHFQVDLERPSATVDHDTYSQRLCSVFPVKSSLSTPNRMAIFRRGPF